MKMKLKDYFKPMQVTPWALQKLQERAAHTRSDVKAEALAEEARRAEMELAQVEQQARIAMQAAENARRDEERESQMDQSREAANNARRGISKSASPGTFTISNLGMFGVEVFPIINPPEAAILGVGDIRQEPKAIGAGIAIRSMMRLVLSADHRAVDGAYAARFLAQLKLDLESHNLSH